MDKKLLVGFIIGLFVIGIIAIIFNLPQLKFALRETAEETADCDDGRGEDYYFDKKELPRANANDLSAFSPEEIPENILAYSEQECSKFTYQIKKDGKMTAVGNWEFINFISEYNWRCGGCLLVYRTGWPHMGKVYQVTGDKPICGTGRNPEEQRCVGAGEL